MTRSLTLTGALLTLAACSGGDVAQPPGFFFGSNDPDTGGNGLGYADDASQLNDLDGQTSKLRMVRYVRDPNTGAARFLTSDDVLEQIDSENFTVTFADETITFVEREAFRADGSSIRSRTLDGNFAQVLEFNSGASVNPVNEETVGYTIVGFETNPAEIASTTGRVFYAGTSFYAGTVSDLDGNVLDDGFRGSTSAFFEADFGSGNITGSYTIDLEDETSVSREVFELELAPTAIIGNGFAGDLTVANCGAGFTCTSASEIGGVFYGPEADNIGGIVGFDITKQNANGDGIAVIGAGGFVAGLD